MAEAQRAVTAAFPPPPPFWKHFSKENVEKLDKLKAESAKSHDGNPKKKWSPSELQALDTPSELRYLIPPKAPTEGTYSVFGELQNLSSALPSLKDQGIEQLYPEPPATDGGKEAQVAQPLNHAFYLLKISKSLLLNFLEFVGILSIAPEQFETKLDDLRNLFINAHHLLNLYRPHQARESLILMMAEQLESTRNEIQEMDQIQNRVERLLEQLAVEAKDVADPILSESKEDTNGAQIDNKTVQEARQLWDLLEEYDS
ncbi:mediator of RNA polymerase II transcription subunit 7 [Talaromyces proteolyticus]|uniref:Mediator of RNA polymerase II transcription subunit 7 n=1 Tax=Talaromyces proteolyticus TaxID=1131652 RepID=A0AAD4KWI7_9EURO|nr:mediator of RNA polymerase II transcription subunit 7 [Talaromyces proteolyticus]KAH8701620.1 mediator of RNA polymerase II transcription subunit 7 [Talaromyces proteolyticus]